MKKLFIDLETYSEADLTKVGLANYAAHPSTRIICASWAWYGEEVRTADSRAADFVARFAEFLEALRAADEVHAWNATFERAILRKHAPPLQVWRCTMAHALYRSLPGSLGGACEAIGLSDAESKMLEGRRLIALFCVPQKKMREKEGDWERFLAYNRRDVEAEMRIYRWLQEQGLDWPEHEVRIWQESEEINARGFPVSVEHARDGDRVYQALRAQYLGSLRRVTGLTNPNSVAQLMSWLEARGVKTGSLDVRTVRELLKRADLSPEVREALRLRALVSYSAPAKFRAFADLAHEGCIRYGLQYSGAGRTHRWSGRGVQPQNLRRGLAHEGEIEEAWQTLRTAPPELLPMLYDAPLTLLADLVRSVIRPTPGKVFIVADFASIEVVVLWWLANEGEKLRAFAQGLDPYKVFASDLFSVPYDAVSKEQRTFAKPAVLGGGFGLGPVTLVEYAAGMGVQMDEARAQDVIAAYRETHPGVVALWRALDSAMVDCIRTGKSYRVQQRLRVSRAQDHVVVRLPSGSEITYLGARVEEVRRCRKAPAGADPVAWQGDPDNWYTAASIVYRGRLQETGAWGDVYTWGGKLVENVVQSVARDVLANALLRLREAGLDVVLHVHDEVVVEAPADRAAEVRRQVEQIMSTAPAWAPDMPVRAAAFETTVYRKD